MKLLVLGDNHGRPQWEEIIKKEQPDLTIFLGDYVSSHESIDSASQITNLEKILQYKESHMDSVILLRGNHDTQHLGYSWAECSGYFPHVGEYLMKNKDRFLSLTQWIYIYNDIIFSHAGISTEWLKVANISSIEEINNIEPDNRFGFWPCKMSDFYGISPTQPCTWIRPQTLVEYMPEGITQVVGHSPVKVICNVGIEAREKYNIKCPDLWCCDALPEQYLIIEDDEFKVINNDK